MTRPRDYAYEALAEVTNTDQTTGRGELNAALATIREETGIVDVANSYVLAAEIHDRAKQYKQLMPDTLLTPTALAKHWKRVAEVVLERKAREPQGTNRPAPHVVCETCGGDRFVIVATRPAPQSDTAFDETAPCPDCNPVEVTWRRHDGTPMRTPDPARTRQLMGKP